MQPDIIPQYFEKFETLEALDNTKPIEASFYYKAETLKISEVLDIDRLFIVAEPGHGKTTLLEQINTHFSEHNIRFQYILGTDSTAIQLTPGIAYLVFDALDESRGVIPTFLEILSLIKGTSIKLIISNRTHYLNAIRHLLVNQEFQFIQLKPFDESQIKAFLKARLTVLNYTSEEINQVIQNSKANSIKSILSTPRYLDEFSKYILSNKLQASQVTALNKSSLFEKIIYFKLDTETKHISNTKYLTKRVLERLALVMEIQGLNQISKEDFITFLDQTDSNISLIFLSSIDLDELLQRVMKTTGENLQFEHTEFQEYLAAKELSRMGYRFQTIHDLMIDPQLQYIRPNWIDVLNFAVDVEPDFARPIIRFMESRRNENIDEKLVQILLNIPPAHFDDEFKHQFFNTVLNYYNSKAKVSFDFYPQLAAYITDQDQFIYSPLYPQDKLTDAVKHIQSNQILLIEALAEKEKLTAEQKQEWTTYLIDLLIDDKNYGIHNTLIHCLITLKAEQAILKIIPVFEKKADYILNNLLYALGKLSPNSPECSNLIKRSIAGNRRLDNLDSLINRITEATPAIAFFQTLKTNISMVHTDHFRYSPGFYGLFDSIEKLKSKKLNNTIEAFVLTVFQTSQNFYHISNLLNLSIKHLIEINPDFMLNLTVLPNFLTAVNEITTKLGVNINIKTFSQIEEFLIENDHYWRLRQLVYKVKQKLENRPDHPVYQYIDIKYLKPWALEKKKEVQAKEKTEIEKLREFYLEDPKYFQPRLIPHFIDKYKELAEALTTEDISYLRGVIEMILKNYQPDLFRIQINFIKQDQHSYTHNQETWLHIELYFKAAYLLQADDILLDHRHKFLKTLPRMDNYNQSDEDIVDKIVLKIGGISDQDAELIYNFCINRKDDLLNINARSLADIALKLKLKILNPVLLKLIKSKKLADYEKEATLKAYGHLASKVTEKKALQQIFNSEKTNTKIKEIANAALISSFKDEKAIKWRFQELETRFRPFDGDFKYSGTRGVSAFESEMDHPEFPKCLFGINLPQVHHQMLQLLTFSFKIRDQRLNFKYSSYLQSIIYSYFQPLLTTKVITALRRATNLFPIVEQTYAFNEVLDKLVAELHQQQKQTEPFATAVHSANQILSKTYLNIQSDTELKELILQIFTNEIKTLIEDEGFYRVSEQLAGHTYKRSTHVDEELIQKTLKIALGKALLENGLRKSDIHREVESLNGHKYDYLISYGLFGPILIELKLMHNQEIQNPKECKLYKEKLCRYLRANQGLGIYAIFQVLDNSAHKDKYNTMADQYSDIPGLEIIAIKCFNESTKRQLNAPSTNPKSRKTAGKKNQNTKSSRTK